jgi:hypothetical protein
VSPASKLVRTGKLPPLFRVATTWHEVAWARACREGGGVRVTIMGASLLLRPGQRVLREGRP